MLMDRICWHCKHFHYNDDYVITCDAFPDAIEQPNFLVPCGIPEEIYDNKVIHDKPYPGDHGIQFEPKDE